jgi:hypothetical protein
MCSHRATALQLTVSRQSYDWCVFRSHAPADQIWLKLLHQRSWWFGNGARHYSLDRASHVETLVAERRHPTGVRFSLNLPVRPPEG